MLMSCVRFSLEGLPRGLFPDSYPSQDLPGAVEVKVLYHLDLIAAFLDKSQEEMMRGHRLWIPVGACFFVQGAVVASQLPPGVLRLAVGARTQTSG